MSITSFLVGTILKQAVTFEKDSVVASPNYARATANGLEYDIIAV